MKYKLPHESETKIQFVEDMMLAVQSYDIVLIDQKVHDLHYDFLKSAINGFDNCQIIKLDAFEETKQLDNVFKIIKKVDSVISSREACLIAVGGGVIGDITGFVSSVVMRGVKYINIPTTLLAMVDSSFGGKNGANTESGKNRIGTFYHPSKIIIDLNFLKSLPDREYKSSFSEIVKAALLSDNKLLKTLQDKTELILRRDHLILKEIISRSLEVKAKFVIGDVRDESSRKLLNLGHSFAHAIEVYSNYSINHGESVALGLAIAIKFSIAFGYCEEQVLKEFHEIINHFVDLKRLFEIFKSFNMEKIVSLIKNDKKNSPTKLNLILIRDISDCFEQKNIDPDELRKFLEKL